MNKTRRTQLMTLSNDLELLQGRLEVIVREEQEAYENLPESLQEASKAGEGLEALEEVLETLKELPGLIREAIE